MPAGTGRESQSLGQNLASNYLASHASMQSQLQSIVPHAVFFVLFCVVRGGGRFSEFN